MTSEIAQSRSEGQAAFVGELERQDLDNWAEQLIFRNSLGKFVCASLWDGR